MKLNKTEIVVYVIVILVILSGAILSFTDKEYYENSFAVEDGIIEYGTALMLFISAIIMAFRFFRIGRGQSFKWKLTVVVLAILFIFAAGEEISWGQRIFGVESSEFFKDNNAQQEMNLHNLVVGETKINKLIFSKMLTSILVIYLIILPVLFNKISWIKDLVTDFAIPVVKYHHTVVFILMTIVVTIMPSGKRWEIYEFGFAMIFFLIFIFPLNKEIYDPVGKQQS